MSIGLIAALMIQTAAPAPQTAVPSAPPANAVAPVDAATRECRNVKDASSRIPQRVCRTKAEWAQQAQAANEKARDTAPMRQDSTSGYK